MFASKTLPKHLPGHRDNDGCVFPDPHFSPRQRNEPNPILVSFRAQGDPEFPGPWIDASYAYALFGGYREWDDPRSYFHAFVGASGAQNRHARHVLTRLAALTAVTS